MKPKKQMQNCNMEEQGETQVDTEPDEGASVAPAHVASYPNLKGHTHISRVTHK